ncbi:MAG: UDP-N,N'-diacetylbacillosamine 2-epimerase (hydrolyzing) [Myxococcota bacterium]|nr:UDP-N,N'-diacetylbacillosamine 2-epimerase (hydrolyzing) [Myxococcota bacterium]
MSISSRRKVCVVLVDRANYGRLKPVMFAIGERPELDLQVVCAGTMLLERFDQPVKVVRNDGFQVHGEIYLELEGSVPTTMAKSVGFGIVEFSSEFQRLKPDIVLLIGDRYEALAAAIAAAYMNIPIFHVQGGEVSGSIDESARHAITKFAQFHFPSTARSAEYLARMGERRDTIVGAGCPSSDIARTLDRKLTHDMINLRGAGHVIDVEKPFLLTLFHPTTTEYGGEEAQARALMEALAKIAMPTLLLWPNIDAGSDHINKVIRVVRTQSSTPWLRTLTNLSPETYLKVLANTVCAVGNSSSFVRDASYFGSPVVLVGNRQNGRETDRHVTRVHARSENIHAAIRGQLEHGRYPPSTLYGDGHVSERIAESLVKIPLYVQKRLSYALENPHEFAPPADSGG